MSQVIFVYLAVEVRRVRIVDAIIDNLAKPSIVTSRCYYAHDWIVADFTYLNRPYARSTSILFEHAVSLKPEEKDPIQELSASSWGL